ncbi:MAG: acyltransferase [Gemmataceae bacterium]
MLREAKPAPAGAEAEIPSGELVARSRIPLRAQPGYAARSFLNWLRIGRLRRQGALVGKRCRIERAVDARLGFAQGRFGRVMIESEVHLSQGVLLHAFGGAITLGRNIFIGPYTVIYGHGGVAIGANSLVSMHCRILSSNHSIPDGDTLIRSQPDCLLATTIGQDVWLGAGVTVLGGVAIGDGCVVGAGAVVTDNLPAYAIAVGVPARVVKYRQGAL